MDFAEYKDILVVLELDEGKPVNVSLENIAAAKAVANGGKVIAVAVASEEGAKVAIEYGADSAIVVEGDQFGAYNGDVLADAVAQIAAEVKPAAIFTGATATGKDLVPRVAAKLAAGAVADATGVKLDDAGNIVFTVPAYAGNVLTDVVIDTVRPQIASIRGGSVPKAEPEAGKAGEIVKKAITVADDQIRIKIKETVKEITESVNLEEAEVIVAGGRGMGSAENFMKLQELADLMGGVIGCTRPAMESGWISRAHQVGQSGKIVAPKLYFAFGISGATQHVSGMIGSGYIVAINKDEDAPIFDVADVGIVGNALDVLPIMIEEIKKLK
ncbi:MAG: electron transfer flavoprotein subunit alpha/FixB family protein [Coprococcus sp.]